jgi:hypothetical protein
MRSSAARLVVLGLVVAALSVWWVSARLAAQAPDPQVWARVQPPGAASEARRCANWTEWSVRVATAKDGGLVATIEAVAGRTPSEVKDRPPFPLVSDIRGVGRTLWMRTKEGYVVAFNHGEFGGSLWWYSATGSSRTRLADAAVVGFADIKLPGRDVVVGTIEGFTHLSAQSGSIRVIERRGPDGFTVTAFSSLSAAPQAVAQGRDGSLVVTNSSIVKVHSSGVVSKVADVNFSSLYPNSVVETADGLIYIGARRYLIQVGTRPQRTRWYTRADCRSFRLSQVDAPTCQCR